MMEIARDRAGRLLLASFILSISLATSLRGQVWPGDAWERQSPGEVGLDEGLLVQARDYALTGGGAGYITRHGRLVMSWGNAGQKFDLKSTSKSIGVTALGLALGDGKLTLDDKAHEHHVRFGLPPESNAQTGWLDQITIGQLAAQTAGFAKPGGYEKLLFAPGTQWHYSDGGPNWLAECITLAYRQDVQELLFTRVFAALGVTPDDLHWRENAYRPHQLEGIPRREFGSGVHANVDAMARIGYLYLRRGRWRDRQLLPAEFVDRVGRTTPEVVGLPEFISDESSTAGGRQSPHGNASDHYGLLWWNNADGTLADVPRDAYWSWGLYDSLIVVIPSLDIVVSRAGKSWARRDEARHYDVLQPFLGPIARAAGKAALDRDSSRKPPYPPSPVIAGIEWSTAESIRRAAAGSDNWPLTWGDDGHLYTAYGDGWGFAPRTEQKLSLGLARIVGDATDWRGENIRSRSVEQLGDGAAGKKASGMLMVDGVLYLWARNAGNSQLAWSDDHGQSWQWSDWRFSTSFGCPTFLNYGRNYAGARDDYVYIYSPDADSAYHAADRMVLARVPQRRILEREAYEFWRETDEEGVTPWSDDIAERGAVFQNVGGCYRGGVSFHAAWGRYLWCQVLPASRHPQGPRFQGGFGVYDAPEPWGPWTTAYYTEDWDVGPGETSSIPTKWISRDGREFHLVFSGDDHFSVRRGVLLKK